MLLSRNPAAVRRTSLEASRPSTSPEPRRPSTSAQTGPSQNSRSTLRTTLSLSLVTGLRVSSSCELSPLRAFLALFQAVLTGNALTGHGQGLNARDNGLNVIVGVREGGESWKAAQEDGWVRSRVPIYVDDLAAEDTARRFPARPFSPSTRLSRRVLSL